MESFTRFGTQLDEETQKQIDRGRAIRLVLEQRQFQPMKVTDQIAIFIATNAGLLDGLDEEKNQKAQKIIQTVMQTDFQKETEAVLSREKLSPQTQEKMLDAFKKALKHERIL